MDNSADNPNRYTIGKYLRKKKSLHRPDPTATIVPPPESLQQYVNYLIENGTVLNKVAFAQFRLKNGLPYCGLVATDKVIADEIVVRIPRPLIFTTKRAYFSELKGIFLENKTFFSPYYTSSWEDHMLLVYLIHEHSKGQQSDWYHLIANLPEDIDYVVFWTEDELNMLEDKSLYRLAKQHKNEYDKEEAFVLEMVQKYPDILKVSAFTPKRIRWAYTHLVTRCFGKYLEYTTMVPFAEFFNHECIDVYYDMEYYTNNPHKPKNYTMDDPKEITEEETETNATSEGSNKSDDVEFDSDYEYDDNFMQTEEDSSIEKKLNGLPILDEIRMRSDDIENFLINEFDWSDGFSIFFVKEVYQETYSILERYKASQLDLAAARNLIMNLETSMVIYKNETRKFLKTICKIEENEFVTKQKKKLMEQGEAQEEKEREERLNKKPTEELFDPDEKWKEDTFDNFIMKASWKDQFDPGAQLYFCYGRLSNRSALLRYGFALEYNKYEHIHLKMPYMSYIKGAEWLVNRIKYFKLSKYMRFKLKRTKVNVCLINFCKGIYFNLDYTNYDNLLKPISLDLELKGVRRAYEFLQEFIESYSKTPEENKKVLQDPNASYHEYFAAVYRLERQRIAGFHSRALLILEEILKRVKKGLTFEFALMRVHEYERESERNLNRTFLKDYLELLESFWAGTAAEKFNIELSTNVSNT